MAWVEITKCRGRRLDLNTASISPLKGHPDKYMVYFPVAVTQKLASRKVNIKFNPVTREMMFTADIQGFSLTKHASSGESVSFIWRTPFLEIKERLSLTLVEASEEHLVYRFPETTSER